MEHSNSIILTHCFARHTHQPYGVYLEMLRCCLSWNYRLGFRVCGHPSRLHQSSTMIGVGAESPRFYLPASSRSSANFSLPYQCRGISWNPSLSGRPYSCKETQSHKHSVQVLSHTPLDFSHHESLHADPFVLLHSMLHSSPGRLLHLQTNHHKA